MTISIDSNNNSISRAFFFRFFHSFIYLFDKFRNFCALLIVRTLECFILIELSCEFDEPSCRLHWKRPLCRYIKSQFSENCSFIASVDHRTDRSLEKKLWNSKSSPTPEILFTTNHHHFCANECEDHWFI